MPLTELSITPKKPKNLVEDSEEDFEDIEEEILDDDEDASADDDVDDNWDEPSNDDDSEDDADEEDDDFEDDEEDEDDTEEDEDDTEEEETKNSSRENERIRQLVAEKNQAAAERESERQQRLAMQKKMAEMQKSMVESSIATLSDQKDLIRKQLMQAQENGDHSVAIDLQEKLSKVGLDLMALESWKPEEIPEQKTQQQQQPNNAPQSFKDWDAKNSWFRNPVTPDEKKRQREAILYSEVLSSEGYNVDSPEYFEMIDKRLKKLGLADKDENDVESTNKSKTSSKGRKKTSKKKISQTVKGSDRASTSRKKSSRKTKVTLDVEEKRIASLMGLTNEEYLEEKINVINSDKANKRMTTLKF